jgi:hypothetical protein
MENKEPRFTNEQLLGVWEMLRDCRDDPGNSFYGSDLYDKCVRAYTSEDKETRNLENLYARTRTQTQNYDYKDLNNKIEEQKELLQTILDEINNLHDEAHRVYGLRPNQHAIMVFVNGVKFPPNYNIMRCDRKRCDHKHCDQTPQQL